MHKGASEVVGRKRLARSVWRLSMQDLLISLGYTVLIVILIQLKVLQPISAYFKNGSG